VPLRRQLSYHKTISSHTLKGLYEKIIEESGFMKNALQIAYASRKTANLLIEKKPAKIHFTGSVEVEKQS
jgi:aldehyde dehydrogenase (NAD+)